MKHKHTKGKFVVKAVMFGIVAAIAMSFAFMLLWNWLMPMIFGLQVLTFWESLGLLILVRIAFGGHHHRDHFHRYHREKFWKDRFHERLEYVKTHKEDSEGIAEQ